MTLTHDKIPASIWGSLYKLHFWRWGITLDWGEHRFILTVAERRSAGSES